MWICRHCAAHVNDDALKCPCCGTAAPARLQPELAHSLSTEVGEPPRREQVRWLTNKTLPNLRKQASSPWTLAMTGFVVGLGSGAINYQEGKQSPISPQMALLQPFLCAMALAPVFGLLGLVLRSRRERWERDSYFVEVGAIIGFFLLLIIAVIDAFTNHWGWESLYYLGRNILYALGMGLTAALLGAVCAAVFMPALKILVAPLMRRFLPTAALNTFFPHFNPSQTDSAVEPVIHKNPTSSEGITYIEDHLIHQANDNTYIQQKND